MGNLYITYKTWDTLNGIMICTLKLVYLLVDIFNKKQKATNKTAHCNLYNY